MNFSVSHHRVPQTQDWHSRKQTLCADSLSACIDVHAWQVMVLAAASLRPDTMRCSYLHSCGMSAAWM